MKKQKHTKTPPAASKPRQRDPAQPKHVLFAWEGWRIVRFNEDNLQLVHESEGDRKARYYSTLGSALKGLVKQVGFSEKTLDEVMNRLDSLNAAITRAGI